MVPPWELVHYTNCILCIKGSAVLSVPVHFCVISFCCLFALHFCKYGVYMFAFPVRLSFRTLTELF